jgi:hypothetical protein
MKPANDKDLQSLVQIREKIQRAEEEIEAIEGAHYQLDEAVSLAKSYLTEARQRSRYVLGSLTRPGDRSVLSVTDVLLGMLTDQEIEKRLRATFGEMIEDPGLPLGERPRAVSKIRKSIEQLLAQEERIICKLEAAGQQVARRIPETAEDVDRLLDAWDEGEAA